MKAFDSRYQEALKVLGEEIKNPMAIPRIKQVSINFGLAGYQGDTKKVEAARQELALIAGQQPALTYAKKSIAAFKLREGQVAGCKVTLRRDKMKSFIDRLIFLALPRVRDFRGLSKSSFDNCGNLSLGLREHIVFPEISYDKIDTIKGMDITIVTSTQDKELARKFLELMGFPFK